MGKALSMNVKSHFKIERLSYILLYMEKCNLSKMLYEVYIIITKL